MNKSMIVFRNELTQFRREKGIIVFYCIYSAILGLAASMMSRQFGGSSLVIAALPVAIALEQRLTNSVAGERDERTLETLLSTPLGGKSIIWGKILFRLVFALCLFGMVALCAVLANRYRGDEMALDPWQWLCIMLMAVFSFSAVSVVGVYTSAKSADTLAAQSRMWLITYPLEFLFLVYIVAINSTGIYPALVASAVLLSVYLCVILIYAARIAGMKQSDYFENLRTKKAERAAHASLLAPKSQFGIVFGFELKQLLAQKAMVSVFGFICFGPALSASLMYYTTGESDINQAVRLAALTIPLVASMALVYNSIGGEKTNRTGESLLSTPLRIRPVFLAKCMVPVLVTALMLVVSSLLILAGITLTGRVMPDMAPVRGYTVEQLVLLFPVSIMFSITVIFILVFIFVMVKNPDYAMYVSSPAIILVGIPMMLIFRRDTDNMLEWFLIYFAALLIVNVIFVLRISNNVSRPQIMGRL